MPTVRRSGTGPQMKGGPTIVKMPGPPPSQEEQDAANAYADAQAGPQFLEKCQIIENPSHRATPDEGGVYGITWTSLDVDREGVPHSYICEGRAMKITANLRAERGESITPQTEWLLFRMGALLGRSRDLEALFRKASEL